MGIRWYNLAEIYACCEQSLKQTPLMKTVQCAPSTAVLCKIFKPFIYYLYRKNVSNFRAVLVVFCFKLVNTKPKKSCRLDSAKTHLVLNSFNVICLLDYLRQNLNDNALHLLEKKTLDFLTASAVSQLTPISLPNSEMSRIH